MQYITNLFLLIILFALKAIKYIFAFILHTKLIIKYFTTNTLNKKQK